MIGLEKILSFFFIHYPYCSKYSSFHFNIFCILNTIESNYKGSHIFKYNLDIEFVIVKCIDPTNIFKHSIVSWTQMLFPCALFYYLMENFNTQLKIYYEFLNKFGLNYCKVLPPTVLLFKGVNSPLNVTSIF